MANEKVLRKLQKLFALAEDNPSEAEAMSALLKAQEMMAEYNLTVEDIEQSGEVKNVEAATYDATGFARNMPWWYLPLAKVIAENFRCISCIGILKIDPLKKNVRFIGLPDDALFAAQAYAFASGQIKFLADRYARRMRNKGYQMKGLRDDFARGFVNGLRDGYQEQVERNDWGLILATHPVVQQASERLGSGPIQTTYQRTSLSDTLRKHAESEGYREGKKVSGTGRNYLDE